MRPGRPILPISVTDEQRSMLENWVRRPRPDRRSPCGQGSFWPAPKESRMAWWRAKCAFGSRSWESGAPLPEQGSGRPAG
jgi:hypothetical protein